MVDDNHCMNPKETNNIIQFSWFALRVRHFMGSLWAPVLNHENFLKFPNYFRDVFPYFFCLVVT